MINMEFINNKFKQKINSNTTIVSLYSSPLFTEFYNQLIKQDNFYNDLNFYQKNILKKEKSIELASGSGRILIPMLKEGYNIIGIEKEREMIDEMPIDYRKHVINEDILDVFNLKEYYKNTNVFLLPATTISLFSLEDIYRFVNNIIKINKDFKFIFDVIDIENLITTRPQKHVTEKGTFYDSNHVVDDKICYNVFHKESNTLGYSLKYNHKIDLLKDTLLSLNMKITEKSYSNSYYMIIGHYNSKQGDIYATNK